MQYFQSKLRDSRFRMFFAVHEFEAWLLSEPAIFPREVQAPIRPKSKAPEQVNFNEPPAKLLDHLYRQHLDRGYKKTVNGKILFAKLNPNVAAEKCPYFQDLLSEMLQMSRAAGLCD